MYWIEAHGSAQMRSIAASPRGVDAIGDGGRLYHYPGPFGRPWENLNAPSATRVAASLEAAYVLDTEGYIWRIRLLGGSHRHRWEYSADWHASFVAADESDRVYVISNGAAHRVKHQELEALACTDSVVALSVARGRAYLVTQAGELLVARGKRCDRVRAPGRVGSVAAYGEALVVVAGGDAYRKQDQGWQKLPRPVAHRATSMSVNTVLQVSLSLRTLWARDGAGLVYMLSESS
jgi:hypothetical protein